METGETHCVRRFLCKSSVKNHQADHISKVGTPSVNHLSKVGTSSVNQYHLSKVGAASVDFASTKPSGLRNETEGQELVTDRKSEVMGRLCYI